MRVAVFSSTRFGHRCIEAGIIGLDGISVCGVLTTPPRISISYAKEPIELCTHAHFDSLAQHHLFPVHVLSAPPREADYFDILHSWRPDLVLALGWYYLIPRSVRDAVPNGFLGVHASLLPQYRGGAPIPWAILRGETETGVTLFHLEDEVDAGDIIAQRRFCIQPDDTCASILERSEEASVQILRDMLPRIADGTAPRIPQVEDTATIFSQRSPADGQIDWSWDAKRIRDFIRAQTRPYPGAWTIIGGKKVVIWDADICEETQ